MSVCKNEIIYRRAPGLSDPGCSYPGFAPESKVLKKGSVCRAGHAPLACDILFERDTAITVRDGTILYADIYRPVGEEKVPAILNSTTFGKSTDEKKPAMIQQKAASGEQFPGVPKSMTSGLNSFESTDPGFFVPHGYAVVNLDIRGSYMSGGDNPYFGTQEAEDDYDVIEWLAMQEWCSGAVAMTGNSWLGINQWFAAAQRPPHLVCIAPWEGWYDMYRDEYMVGGIPNYPGFRFNNAYSEGGKMEDVVANCLAHPLLDEYWKDKAAHPEKIEIPVYATASWSSVVHCQGTLNAWRKVPTDQKWLRVHNTQEWRDTYDENNSQDLLRFFDHYMKKEENGWENTPKVRLSVLDPGGQDIVERPEKEFPLERQRLCELYLDAAAGKLCETLPEKEAEARYSGWNGKDMVKFRYTFDKETELVGYSSVRLYVESHGYNDLDLFVKLEKLGADGRRAEHISVATVPDFDRYSGPTGRQRVSLRNLDPEKSAPNEPYHTFDQVQKLRPHEIVPVEIGLFPTGLRFHKGESIELKIAGWCFYDVPGGFGNLLHMGIDNNGEHVIHTGGQFASKVVLPMIPLE
ncbi:CocE/NonD family hydrolase [Anaerofilum sp. BX8]|uniref:CocE/NonD family hydrolase n=1 Tax=Anaerofilum hominis TaxID=2763016 RepID=A0A923IBG2_9FIRM|nr:CocE/NonD family hydrolase [Anaerofilum hominis]MBC5581863.1 CocE/NonD family hydrolase [Anaerofilum hominis]